MLALASVAQIYAAMAMAVVLQFLGYALLIQGYGSMTTIASLWGPVNPLYLEVPLFSACALEVQTLIPRCFGTYQINNDTSPPQEPLRAISAGGYFVCGLSAETHYPVCWASGSSIPAPYVNRPYSSIASGGYHVCAVQANGAPNPGMVDCWGANYTNQADPPAMAMLSVSSGERFSCGISAASKRAVCWGLDITALPNVVLQPAPETSFETISAGNGHVCGIESGTNLTICWGNNTSNQAIPPVGITFIAISAGYAFTCGIRKDSHETFCWGDASLGQLDVPSGIRFSTISAGDYYTCGVSEGPLPMKVICWGLKTAASASLISTYVPSNLNASLSLCVMNCQANQHQVLNSDLGVSRQCPNIDEKVCLEDCPGACTPQLAQDPSTFRPLTMSPGSGPEVPPSTVPDLIPLSSSSISSRRILMLALVTTAVALTAIFALIVLWILISRVLLRSTVEVKSASPWISSASPWSTKACKMVRFTSEDLQTATKNYGTHMVVGQGSFGIVYKGVLPDGQVVAVKKASIDTGRAVTFEMELQLLSRLHHKHLVNLVGYCQEEKVLVFEFMANGSLKDCLFGEGSWPPPLLDWKARLKISLQAARGLEYLHVYASPKVIHRDVKPANILLDKYWDAHLADFGLSLNGPIGSHTHLSNEFPAGTPGYADPDGGFPFKLTAASDVYSYGVVLLELLSGREALGRSGNAEFSVVSWALHLASRGEHLNILDARMFQRSEEMAASGPLLQVVKLALQCVRIPARDRPSISKVVSSLQAVVEPWLTQDFN